MSGHHADRSPLLLKMALRHCATRLREEGESLSQYRALAHNLLWDDVAEALTEAMESLREAADRIAGAAEAAARLQAKAAPEHSHEHPHAHGVADHHPGDGRA